MSAKDAIPMFSEAPKVIVNEYKSLDDELSATIAGVFVEGRQSNTWVVDIKEEVSERIIPVNITLIKQAFDKWLLKHEGEE